MEKQKSIVVIGGTACGPKAAARARRLDQKAKITIIEEEENLSTATCGMPYYIGGVIKNQSKLIARRPDFFKEQMNIDVLNNTRAVAIDRKAHMVELLDPAANRRATISYDKLVLATGSVPAVPNLEGRNLGGIFTLTKLKDAVAIRSLIAPHEIRSAIVVGAGLIGLETAENFVKQGLEVTMIEALDWALPGMLDFEIAAPVEKHLRSKGINLILGQRVAGFEGDADGWVRKVVTKDTALEGRLVLLALGVKPNVKLAQEAGLRIGKLGGIDVNEYLETDDPDIYAGGDCVENVNRITGRKMLAPLGSTANKHGRVIGTNVTGGRETFPGVVGTFVIKIFDFNVARVGLTEAQAKQAGFNIVTALVPSYEHATYYPGSKEILVKLIADKATGKLLGGQVVGPGDSAKRIDVLATALSFGATVDDLANLDLSYAPPFNSAMDPLHAAANVIRNKRDGLARGLSPMAVKEKIDRGEEFILLDVRTLAEWNARRIEAPQTKFVPIRELRARLEELPQGAEIVTLCQSSIRAYNAQRILEGAGFKNVKFLDGSILGWPYEVSGTKPRTK
jgi:NADPH-dependent 2,4-dienoyl-CoA reductase/sulfur reductase-like enzyme/rhodanese-related sulfurtransferase